MRFAARIEARDAKKKLDLRDESGERVIASRRTAARVAITEPMLRREVARDLDALDEHDRARIDATTCGEFEHVRRSILNFGIPDIAHRRIDEIAVDDISRRDRDASDATTSRAWSRDTIQVDARQHGRRRRAARCASSCARTCRASRSTFRSSSSPTSRSTAARS